jgi:HEAT repeat protein
MSSRAIKQEVLALLALADLDHISREVRRYGEKDLVNPLFSALSRPEETVRWHAISIFGQVVPRLADQDMEAARIVMRRFLWSLNDESGGIGWGAPEAMAEIMLHHDLLAGEYLHMLISYLQPDGPLAHQDGNYIELPALQRGVLWGIGRLAAGRAKELLARGVPADLLACLHSEDGGVRGLAVWALGRLQGEMAREEILPLATDTSSVRLYEQGRIRVVSVAELVKEALAPLSAPCGV